MDYPTTCEVCADLAAGGIGTIFLKAEDGRIVLTLRLLGEIQVVRDGEPLDLPPSRKTRALLAYLAATGRAHRRERLCSLFWEVPDDPRGALRWSLSRLRGLVDEPNQHRIVATRETVNFEPIDMDIDLARLRQGINRGLVSLSVEELEQLAASFRGEFLEGVDLPDLHDFQAWCLAEREDIRRNQAQILSILIGRLAEHPEAALSHARQLVQIDPFNEAARASLLQFLLKLERRTEAEQHYEAAVRVLQELGNGAEMGLVKAWRTLRSQVNSVERPQLAETILPKPAAQIVPDPASLRMPASSGGEDVPLVGRDPERRQLLALLNSAKQRNAANVVLLTAEPGLGKSRLIEELIAAAHQRGIKAFSGSAYETEKDHPYGPWIEALSGLPDSRFLVAKVAPPLNGDDDLAERAQSTGRKRLFDAAARLVFGADNAGRPILITLDDVQWCDEASANLLHYIVRLGRQRPLTVVLAARDGELADNPAMLTALRSLRHLRILREMRLAPLSSAEIERLVRASTPNVDVPRVVVQCEGNPLFALELSRSLADGQDELPRSLKELVRDRIERLPGSATDLLRWASVVGPVFSVTQLLSLTDASVDAMTRDLEVLERHALLREDESDDIHGAYRFGHDLIHQAVYTGISEPRRRLMHLKMARILHADGADNESIAPDIVHHAGLAGDASMAASACVRAGRRSLRVFANTQAATMARRGLRFAEMLPEKEQVQRTLELMQVEFLAQRPDDRAATISRLERLAGRALDLDCLEHARLGYHLLSYLRWEGGLWSDAQRDTLRAELVSRSENEKQRVVAMAETARCLAMLERDLGQAEALVLEAQALAHRLGIEPNAIADAAGLLRAHQGDDADARALFSQARVLARRDGDRSAEFMALEHLVALEIQGRNFVEAEVLCNDLIELAGKLRGGSEAPFARALQALCRLARGNGEATASLDESLTQLRHADAKHRLALTLLVAAELDVENGRLHQAQARADEALQTAILLDRSTEILLAHVVRVRIATERDDDARLRQDLADLRQRMTPSASSHAKRLAQQALESDGDFAWRRPGHSPPAKGGPKGAMRRRSRAAQGE